MNHNYITYTTVCAIQRYPRKYWLTVVSSGYEGASLLRTVVEMTTFTV
jgi:hypothetical protein